MLIKKTQKNKKKWQGFMMVELVLSIFILGTILISFVQVISKNYAQKNNKIDIVIATSLAQEGIELVRNTRDINWMATTPVAGFTGWTNNTKDVRYDNILLTSGSAACSGATGCVLYVDANGFYTTLAANNTATKFSRKVNISASGTNKLITSTVYWNNQFGTVQNIVATDILSNWGDI